MMLPNWMPAKNTWDLPAPPQWFLQRLYDFDAMLVIFPSQARPTKDESPHYMLARRRQLTVGMSSLAILENKHPDTNLMIANGLVPIGPLRFKKGVRTFTQAGLVSLLDDLKSRDQWALTGGLINPDAGWQALEAAEAKQQKQERKALRDTFAHMARDAYRSLKARTGQRNKRSSDYHGVARQPQTAQGVILTDAQ